MTKRYLPPSCFHFLRCSGSTEYRELLFCVIAQAAPKIPLTSQSGSRGNPQIFYIINPLGIFKVHTAASFVHSVPLPLASTIHVQGECWPTGSQNTTNILSFSWCEALAKGPTSFLASSEWCVHGYFHVLMYELLLLLISFRLALCPMPMYQSVTGCAYQ